MAPGGFSVGKVLVDYCRRLSDDGPVAFCMGGDSFHGGMAGTVGVVWLAPKEFPVYVRVLRP